MGGVIANAGSTLMEMVPETIELPCESVTFAVKLKVPGTVVDEIVPLILPAVLRLRLVGRLPELIVQVKGPTPPVCARGVAG